MFCFGRKLFSKTSRTTLTALFFLTSCTKSTPTGTVNLTVIQPTGPSCQYKVGPVPIQTLENVFELRGLLGKVVTYPGDLESSEDILQLGLGFQIPDFRFAGSGNVFGGLDRSTLLASSLYYSIEKAYGLFKTLDVSSDLLSLVPNMRETYIIHNAELLSDTTTGKAYSDNAAYVQIDGPNGARDYFLSFPNETISKIPLGFNAGVMAHEYTHMVAQYLFHNRRSSAGKELSGRSENTLAAFEEGFADYFGFLASSDPSFFHCSFPLENDRNLANPKALTVKQSLAIQSSVDFDSHEGGAVYASVQYQIGQLIGHEENARSLIRFLGNLASCTGLSSSRATISFSTLRNCHLQALGGQNSNQIQQIYQSAFANEGGF